MDGYLDELYQDVILTHNRHPKNKGPMASPSGYSHGYNPSCGDDIKVFVVVEDGVIESIKFDGEGCAISQASASLMTELLTGKSTEEAKTIIDDICKALGEEEQERAVDVLSSYGELAALVGVRKFPMRLKCATLAWHAAKNAISSSEKS